MLMKNTFLFLLCMLQLNAFSQKQDYIWVLGRDRDEILSKKQSYRLDFNNEALEIPQTDNFLNFDSNNASICDAEGNLLVYSNGCAIANAMDELMENGDSINAGKFFDTYWKGNCDLGYPGVQDMMFLPDPSNETGYYLIHKRRENKFSKTFIESMLYSYVDMSYNEGLGKVTLKNQEIDNVYPKNYVEYFLTAIQHENGVDWWIINPSADTSGTYFTYLLDSEGFHKQEAQVIGNTRNPETFRAGGTAKFSPDGKHYAHYIQADGLELYDFDRSTGLLSNHRSLDLSDTTKVLFASVEWSPNSRFIYASHSTELYQIDTWEEDLADGTVKISEWSGLSDPFPNVYFLMSLAPDCRIYMCSTSGTPAYHVIHYPDEKGVDCGFVEAGLQLDRRASFASFPNFPRWRVDEEMKCDSSILTMFGKPVYYSKQLLVYPNPTPRNEVRITIPDTHREGILTIYTQDGRLIEERAIITHTEEYILDLSSYSSGIYFISYIPRDNPRREIYDAKLVVR